MIKLTIPIEPKGAVRMTQRGKYKSVSAQRYLAYKNFIQWKVKQQLKGANPLTKALSVNIVFIMPIPVSYTKLQKTTLVNTYHVKKPDIDNLVKGCFDALNKLVWKDDNQVARVTATKIYGSKPQIEIEIEEIRGKLHVNN